MQRHGKRALVDVDARRVVAARAGPKILLGLLFHRKTQLGGGNIAQFPAFKKNESPAFVCKISDSCHRFTLLSVEELHRWSEV